MMVSSPEFFESFGKKAVRAGRPGEAARTAREVTQFSWR